MCIGWEDRTMEDMKGESCCMSVGQSVTQHYGFVQRE
jgi:hypothetical protein